MKKMLVVLNIIFLSLMVFLTLKITTGNYSDSRIVIVAILAYFFEVIVFLYLFLYIPDHIKETIDKIIKLYLIIFGSIFLLIMIIQWITGWTLILYLSYRFIIYAFFIYPAILKLFLKLISYYEFKTNLFLTGLVSFVVILIMGIHGILFGLDDKYVSLVSFDEPQTIDFLLVEEKSFLVSHHDLYIKENFLFATYLEDSKYWYCIDYCVSGNPDAYDWVWLDENTLEVSGGGLSQPVIFHIYDN
ncbi:hypothetical protein [Mariniplasma anaerobium]|uniref:Uncharacterized protein n=1 Tax=Mariniplasma anaerobium TaxID=2735436 RepID=A0A7U9XUZ1_9MOLU|nr:hypothetical protein [Mariniplasma anaerobium]BCR36683.1 hypothetical protein MPAN_015760 [Mariniplasma anaerobium]